MRHGAISAGRVIGGWRNYEFGIPFTGFPHGFYRDLLALMAEPKQLGNVFHATKRAFRHPSALPLARSVEGASPPLPPKKTLQSIRVLDGVQIPNGILPWLDGVLVTAAAEIFYAEDAEIAISRAVARP